MNDLNQLFMASTTSSSSNNANSPSNSSISPPPQQQLKMNGISNSMNSFNGGGMNSSNSTYGGGGGIGGSGNREFGFVEKILQNYGFIKHLTKENRMFFYYSFSLQNELQLKVGDVVEYEETIDKRNGKPLAINIIKQNGLPQQQQQQHQVSLGSNEQAILNLKELLLKAESSNLAAQVSNQVYNQQEQSYQYLMNGLKMLNIQQQQQQLPIQQPEMTMSSNVPNAAVSNLSSNLNILSLFNKSGSGSSSSNGGGGSSMTVNGNGEQQMSPFGSNDNLKSMDNLISTDYLEGTIVNLAAKRSNNFVSLFLLNIFAKNN